MIAPPWMTWAYGEMLAGVREIPGPEHHPRILEYFELCGASWVADDETHWCAAGVGAALVSSGLKLPSIPLRARAYLPWGASVDPRHPPFGAIAIFSRGAQAPGPEVLNAPGHVGMIVALGQGEVLLLGANQGNTWSIRPFPVQALLGVRWPAA